MPVIFTAHCSYIYLPALARATVLLRSVVQMRLGLINVSEVTVFFGWDEDDYSVSVKGDLCNPYFLSPPISLTTEGEERF